MFTKISILFLIPTMGFCWDWSFKGDFSSTKTSNVNSTNTNIIADTYTDLTGTLQLKNNFHKFKLKYKTEKFKVTTADNSNYTNFGYTYKQSSENEYSAELFKQKYPVTPTINTDTSSDNSGGKIGTTISKNFTKDKLGYISLFGTYKNYVNTASRKDNILDATFGYENYVTENFSVTPELNFEYNKSKDSYYSNMNLGPALYLSYTANDNLEFFLNSLLIYTSYSNRPFTEQLKNRTITNQEHQTLFTTEVGMIWNLSKYFPLQIKYANNKNSSNNSSSAYQSHLFTIGLGIKI